MPYRENSNFNDAPRLETTADTTAAEVQQWIINNFSGGIRRLNIFSSENTQFLGEAGNFQILCFGNHAEEITMIAINHWNAHAWIISASTTALWNWTQLYK